MKAQEGLLVQVFGNDVGRRSRLTEKAMIGRTVYSKNMLVGKPVFIQFISTSKLKPESCWSERVYLMIQETIRL